MAIAAKTSVFTSDGWVYAKDIRPGDWVFNRLGQPVKVKLAQTYRSEECYRVTFDDYLTVDGDSRLGFPAEDRQYRKHASAYKGKKTRTTKLKTPTVVDMLDRGLIHRESRLFFSVPTTEPIQLPTQPLDIPPFVYAFWFFSRKADKVLSAPYEFADYIFEKFKDSGYKVEKLGDYLGKYEKFRTEPSIWGQLAGQIPHKIPKNYLNGSIEQRLELFRGAIMTKPRKKDTSYKSLEYKSNKKHFSVAIQYLAETLGALTRLFYDKTTGTHDVTVIRLAPILDIFQEKRPVVHLARRYVKSIQPIPAQLCVHIETEDEDGSFLVNEGFIPCR